ncbi:DUF2314 domain-containing protein [Janthinobacterium sp. UMAB-60]|uniref:DUF2314 domain-containing protein n=1 Tax=Janthinobacterium sp. UMAB-60 TaxID=1365365 RepID=UPI001C55C835|nr:DUF2314 domain-containing protein [Janthinobacterium sp. UMAB-60]
MNLYHMIEADDPVNKMTTAWKFHDAPNTACFTTTEVVNGAPIVHVSHDYEGDWQFYGASDATASSSAKIASLAGLIGTNDLLADLHDLPYGWSAHWDAGAGNWERFKDHPFPSFAEQGYYLEDAIWLSRYLTDIEPPPAAVRDALPIGAYVKLVFRFAAEDAARGDGQCERMWVQVTGIDEEEGWYSGTIENDPQHLAARYGDLIAFHPLHVADLAHEQA